MFKKLNNHSYYIYEQAQKVAYQLEFGTIFSWMMASLKMRTPTLAEVLSIGKL